ncbi:MAG: OadG family protein [Clostridiales bacterium]|nr:OadG family protein [Clostridiales bacterium]
MMDPIIRFASESGDTFHFLKPQMDVGTALMDALIVMLVVFGVLFLMYVLISLASRVIAGISGVIIGGSKKDTAEPVKAAPVAAEAPAVKEDPGEEFSSGTLKLKGCDEKTAAMIMAIVSDNTGIPLSELVFKSIKLVDEN